MIDLNNDGISSVIEGFDDIGTIKSIQFSGLAFHIRRLGQYQFIAASPPSIDSRRVAGFFDSAQSLLTLLFGPDGHWPTLLVIAGMEDLLAPLITSHQASFSTALDRVEAAVIDRDVRHGLAGRLADLDAAVEGTSCLVQGPACLASTMPLSVVRLVLHVLAARPINGTSYTSIPVFVNDAWHRLGLTGLRLHMVVTDVHLAVLSPIGLSVKADLLPAMEVLADGLRADVAVPVEYAAPPVESLGRSVLGFIVVTPDFMTLSTIRGPSEHQVVTRSTLFGLLTRLTAFRTEAHTRVVMAEGELTLEYRKVGQKGVYVATWAEAATAEDLEAIAGMDLV